MGTCNRLSSIICLELKFYDKKYGTHELLKDRKQQRGYRLYFQSFKTKKQSTNEAFQG